MQGSKNKMSIKYNKMIGHRGQKGKIGKSKQNTLGKHKENMASGLPPGNCWTSGPGIVFYFVCIVYCLLYFLRSLTDICTV